MEKKTNSKSGKSEKKVTRTKKVVSDNKKIKVNTVVTEKVKEEPIITTSKHNNSLYFSYGFRLVFGIVTFILFFVMGLFFMVKSFSFKSGESINYQEKSNLDYKVYLKENNFYDSSYLGKNMVYVASLIDRIDVDFNYNFDIDRNANIDFTYEIIGKLTIADGDGKNIFFEKEYNLLDRDTDNMVNSSFYSINKSVSIDYDYYNSLSNQFRINYGIDTISNLTVYFKIKQNSENIDGFNLDNDSIMSVTIPLSEKAVDIKLDYKEVNDNKKLLNSDVVMVNNYLYITLGIISIMITLISIVKVLRLIGYINPKRSNYDKYINKLLREYDRLIIETTSPPFINENNVIKINKFQELLDARDNLKLPIKYYVVAKHQKCYFYINHNDEIYLLTIKAVDLEEPNHEK